MINQYRGEFHLAKMCKVLGVSRSGYYLWETRPECVSQAVNKRLLDEIIRVYESSRMDLWKQEGRKGAQT